MTPPVDLFRAVLRAAAASRYTADSITALPAKTVDAICYSIEEGCIDPATYGLTDVGRRVLGVLGG